MGNLRFYNPYLPTGYYNLNLCRAVSSPLAVCVGARPEYTAMQQITTLECYLEFTDGKKVCVCDLERANENIPRAFLTRMCS